MAPDEKNQHLTFFITLMVFYKWYFLAMVLLLAQSDSCFSAASPTKEPMRIGTIKMFMR